MSNITRLLKKLKAEVKRLEANQKPIPEPEVKAVISASGCCNLIPKTPIQLIKEIKRKVKLMEGDLDKLKDRIINSEF